MLSNLYGSVMFGGSVLKKLGGIGEPEGKAGVSLGGSLWSHSGKVGSPKNEFHNWELLLDCRPCSCESWLKWPVF